MRAVRAKQQVYAGVARRDNRARRPTALKVYEHAATPDRILSVHVCASAVGRDLRDRARHRGATAGLHAGCVSALRVLHTGRRSHYGLLEKRGATPEQALLRRVLPGAAAGLRSAAIR